MFNCLWKEFTEHNIYLNSSSDVWVRNAEANIRWGWSGHSQGVILFGFDEITAHVQLYLTQLNVGINLHHPADPVYIWGSYCFQTFNLLSNKFYSHSIN